MPMRAKKLNIRHLGSPVKCSYCGRVYDLLKVKVIHRHVDCTTFQTPCCNKQADDRTNVGLPAFHRIQVVSNRRSLGRRFMGPSFETTVTGYEEYDIIDDYSYTFPDAVADIVTELAETIVSNPPGFSGITSDPDPIPVCSSGDGGDGSGDGGDGGSGDGGSGDGGSGDGGDGGDGGGDGS